jgi:hypothetical protein
VPKTVVVAVVVSTNSHSYFLFFIVWKFLEAVVGLERYNIMH